VPLLIDLAEHATLEGLGVEHVGVQKDNKAQILTDAHFATNVASIYAIGDVIAGPMLAHKAEDEDVAVAEMPPAARVTRDSERGLHLSVPGSRFGQQVLLHGQWPRRGQPHH
jgi:pyruvate/2-oxoglutarate dehydrogenase complex dihydrolipoamide dehydrogenase (E3) component